MWNGSHLYCKRCDNGFFMPDSHMSNEMLMCERRRDCPHPGIWYSLSIDFSWILNICHIYVWLHCTGRSFCASFLSLCWLFRWNQLLLLLDQPVFWVPRTSPYGEGPPIYISAILVEIKMKWCDLNHSGLFSSILVIHKIWSTCTAWNCSSVHLFIASLFVWDTTLVGSVAQQ